mgnify:CR=1 FL=1
MVEKQRTCNHLLLLVGSNPLPNFLATLVFNPKTVRLFHSPETEAVKDILKKIITARCTGVSLSETCIGDATDAAKVRSAFTSIPNDAHLHYTGGTKIMAAHARMAFREANGHDDHASYLDERKGVIRFDDGYKIDISKERLALTIDDVLGLHGIQPISKDGPFDPEPSVEDARKIAKAVLRDSNLATTLYNLHRKDGKRISLKEAKARPKSMSEYNLCLSASQVPENQWNNKTYEKWCDFLGGGWLEAWCGDLVREIADKSMVSIGLDCKLASGRQFEIDVALVRGYRLYVISCTTDTKINMCKSKLFEVAMRARQLGGDLARSALVCLLQGSDSKGAFVDQLRYDVADVWDAPNTPQVFGLYHLKEWVGMNDSPPKRDSLKNWLDS